MLSLSDKEKRLDPPEKDHPKLLRLPNVGGKGFTKAEMDLIQEMDPDIEILPDGSYTINGQTPAEILAKYEMTIKDLVGGFRSKDALRLVPGGNTKVKK